MSEHDSSCAAVPLPSPAEYRLIEGCPGYCVGSDGTVWTRWQRAGQEPARLSAVWRLMRASINKHGETRHLIVTMTPNGEKKSYAVHRLVLEAFVGMPPSGMQCCHENGDGCGNLRWDTPAANAKDRSRHGTDTNGERSGMAKLTEQQVRAMRQEYAAGEPIQRLAVKYGLCRNHTGDVVKGKSWKHVK